MPRARKKSNGNGNGTAPLQPMSKKMMKRKKPIDKSYICLLYTSPSPRDRTRSRMPSSA